MALSDNVVGYWKLDESSGNAADSSGNSNTLTNNNTAVYSAGKINNGIDFESSSSQSLSIADGSQTGLDLSGDCSFAGWVKFESFASANVLFAKTDGNSARSYIVRVLSSGDGYLFNAECYGDGTTSNRRGANSNAAFTTTTGTWYHFAATFDVDTGAWVFYKDGAVIASTASNAGTVASIYNSSNKFQIGATNNAGTDEQFADAMMDEMGVWSRTLSPGEVAQLYNAGTGLQYPFTNPPIAYDSASTQFTATGGNATASGSFTCGSGSNRIMFISIGNFSGADDLTAVTYGGVSATLVAKKGFNTIASPTNYAYLYYLVAPATGANTLSATRTNTTSTMFLMATTYIGASQSGVPDASATNATDDAATVSTSVTSIADNCWTVIAAGSQRNLSASSGVTVRSGDATNAIIGDSNAAITPAGSSSIVLAISGASSRLTGTIMASFAPVSASGPSNLKSLDTNVKANIKSYNTNVIANVKSINTNA